MGILLLEGGREFEGKMAEPDKKALALAGGKYAKIMIIPTAAAPDNNTERAGDNALKWFQMLGASNIISLPITDNETADDPEISAQLKQADLIYIPGGFPGYLENTLNKSRCLDAIWSAYHRGAVIAGSSAGAMVLCEWYFDPQDKKIKKGWGIQKKVFLIPHHNTFGSSWNRMYFKNLTDVLPVGIDEQTGMINQPDHNQWTVYGKGEITLYLKTSIVTYKTGQSFRL